MWNLGIGLTIDSQFIKLGGVVNPATMQEETLRLRFTTFHIQAGYGFFDGQLILGGGLRILRQRTFQSREVISDGDVYQALGLGAEVGVMIRPHHERWSLGASLFPHFDRRSDQGKRRAESRRRHRCRRLLSSTGDEDPNDRERGFFVPVRAATHESALGQRGNASGRRARAPHEAKATQPRKPNEKRSRPCERVADPTSTSAFRR